MRVNSTTKELNFYAQYSFRFAHICTPFWTSVFCIRRESEKKRYEAKFMQHQMDNKLRICHFHPIEAIWSNAINCSRVIWLSNMICWNWLRVLLQLRNGKITEIDRVNDEIVCSHKRRIVQTILCAGNDRADVEETKESEKIAIEKN